MSHYPPTPQRKACNCSDPCISTDDVYYAGPNLPYSGINTYNVLTEVIEKLDAIYSFPTLQKVTEAGNYTTLPLIADSFVKIGGDGNNLLLDNGTVLPIGDLPAGVTETSQLINDGEDGINPFITALDIPAFNPSNYDLDEFTNTGIDPFAHVSDIPAAPGLQEVLAEGNSFTDNQMTAYDPISDTNTYIRPYGFTFQRDYDLTEYTYNGVHFTTMGGLDVKSNMLNPKRETIGSATYIFPEKPSGTYTLATLNDIPAPLGYTPVNKAGDTMLGDLILNQDPSTALGAATKQYVDRIESGTYAEYVQKINDNALLPERYYAITDYQHKYCIEESNSSAKKVFKTVTSKISNFLVFDDDNAYDLNVGTVVTIEYLPPTYTGGLVVGNTTTVTENQFNYYYRFANGMSYDPSILGVEISYSYARFTTRTDLNNATVYDAYNKVILKPGGVLNTDVHDGTPYGDLSGSENFTPPVESIVLKAKSTNSFYENCYSLSYLNDEMIYDFTSNIVYNDNKEQIGTRNGFIKRRFNKDINIDIDKDWRVQRYRRWMVPVATQTSDYRKKLLNIDYPNTNTYLAFQNKYLYTSELLNVNSTWSMYICTKIETTSLTAGITGSVTSFPIVMDGTGGLNSTEGIVKFKDYTILELDSFLEPVEVEKCLINNLENTIFINTDATQKGNLKVGNDITFSNSTFFGYPSIKCSVASFSNVALLDKIELFGTNISLTNVNALSYLYVSLLDVSLTNTVIGSLPYGVTFTGMGPAPSNTAVRWLTLEGQMSTLKNCLIGCGVASIQLNNSTISGGGLFVYTSSSTNTETSFDLFKLFSSKFTNVNYHNYYVQTQTVDNVVLSSKQIRISETTNGGIIRSDSTSALYYQNVNVASPFNTVTKNYNYTTFLFETVLNIKPYKTYVALLTQTNTSAPTATILENTLGGTITWSYLNPGQYQGTLTGAFTLNKTVVFLTGPQGQAGIMGAAQSLNSVSISVRAITGAGTDGILLNTPIEIRVYT